MTKKNDPLVESVKKVMVENDIRRAAEALVNESLGIQSKRALPHEYHAEYDAILAEATEIALEKGLSALKENMVGDPGVSNPLSGAKAYINSGWNNDKKKLKKQAKEMLGPVAKKVKEKLKLREDKDKEEPKGREAWEKKLGYERENEKTDDKKGTRSWKVKRTVKESEQLDELTGKGILKHWWKGPGARHKLIARVDNKANRSMHDLKHADFRGDEKESVKQAKKLDRLNNISVKVKKIDLGLEESSLESIQEEIRNNLLSQMMEAYESDENTFNAFVDNLTEEEISILELNDE